MGEGVLLLTRWMRWLFRGRAELRAQLQAALADVAEERERAAQERAETAECRAKQAELRGLLRDAEHECATARAECAVVADEGARIPAALADAREQLAAAQLELSNTGAALAAAEQRVQNGESPPPVVDDLILLMDRLTEMATGGLTPDQFGMAIAWLADQTESLLETCEVDSFVDSAGQVDPARHYVVSTRVAPDQDHIGRIAESVRPGYAWRDETLRPQAVIAYIQGGGE
jgi:molecular chaperone GrpE (heat shock protein)